jgi:uncharacterized BrkB/YihY/UPF0761 family membrane protein
VRWPLGLVLTWASYTVLLARAPRRRQPGYSWLAVGGSIAIVLWLLVTVLLAIYVGRSAGPNDARGARSVGCAISCGLRRLARRPRSGRRSDHHDAG